MKFVYYIVAIACAFTGLAAYGLFDTRFGVSHPFLSVNDRMISEDEFNRMLKKKPDEMSRQLFVESLIDRQVLIQEALKLEIDRDEQFRQTIEDYYEDVLIESLLEQKMDSILVDVTNDELSKYETLMTKRIGLIRRLFPSMADFNAGTNETRQELETDFTALPDDLRFIVLNLKKGKTSPPRLSGKNGIETYTLDRIEAKNETSMAAQDLEDKIEFDIRTVSLFLEKKKKEQRLDDWKSEVRESADIWRKK